MCKLMHIPIETVFREKLLRIDISLANMRDFRGFLYWPKGCFSVDVTNRNHVRDEWNTGTILQAE